MLRTVQPVKLVKKAAIAIQPVQEAPVDLARVEKSLDNILGESFKKSVVSATKVIVNKQRDQLKQMMKEESKRVRRYDERTLKGTLIKRLRPGLSFEMTYQLRANGPHFTSHYIVTAVGDIFYHYVSDESGKSQRAGIPSFACAVIDGRIKVTSWGNLVNAEKVRAQ